MTNWCATCSILIDLAERPARPPLAGLLCGPCADEHYDTEWHICEWCGSFVPEVMFQMRTLDGDPMCRRCGPKFWELSYCDEWDDEDDE